MFCAVPLPLPPVDCINWAVQYKVNALPTEGPAPTQPSSYMASDPNKVLPMLGGLVS